jgi:hypothetical protein
MRPAFTFTREGIDIPNDLTLDEWRRGLAIFNKGEGYFRMARADYISHGEKKFGAGAVRDALGQYEFDLQIVIEADRIGSIPESIRHKNLTPEHYVVLAKAGLGKKELKRWADTASAQNLAPSTLKVSIEHGEVISTQIAKKYTSGQLTIHGLMHEFRILKERVGGIEGILAMSEAGRNEWLNEMREAIEFYHAVMSRLHEESRPSAEEVA